MAMTFSAIPYRIRHALARLAKSDKLLLDFDPAARAEYETRVTAVPEAKAEPEADTAEREAVGAS
jgi:hypothetical protein